MVMPQREIRVELSGDKRESISIQNLPANSVEQISSERQESTTHHSQRFWNCLSKDSSKPTPYVSFEVPWRE
jgi:hypothetical protein